MLKTIIFDIDGTLWHTGASYIYAYHRLCELYGVNERRSNEEIAECLGVKIDKVLRFLFPQVEDQSKLTLEALRFSVEYLTAHADECCFEGVTELLQKLSEQYDLYLVSNCIKDYADAFLRLSGTKAFIKGIYTIEDGEKTENIAKISRGSEGKLLFVGDSTDDYESLTDRYTQFFCYAKYGYKNCERYDYSIEKPLELNDVVRQISVKERQSGGVPYRVFSLGDNQITLIRKSSELSFFGFVKYADDRFEELVKELKSSCSTRLIGPIDFSTYYPYRFAADNFDFRLYPDLAGEKELPVFLENGFSVHKEYISTLAEIDFDKVATFRSVSLPEGYRMEELHGDEVYAHLSELYDVASSVFEKAYLNEPISREDFIDIYVGALKDVLPDLLMVYHNEEPVAFCFCYEDPEKRFYVCKTIGVKATERSRKIIYKLLEGAFAMMKKRGHLCVLLHFRMVKDKKLFAPLGKRTIRQKKYILVELCRDK